MKNFKKFLTLVLAVMMVVSSVAFSTSAATTKFEDVDAKNETLVKAVDLLSYMGVAKGTSETTFGADELVTRQQFALFVYRLMKGGKDAPAGAANGTKFTDLEDPTYNYAIAWANAEGIVNGKSETTFAPKDGIKLQEAYAMLVRALGWEEEEQLIYPFGHIEVAEQDNVELDNGLASSVGYTDELTRGDMAILLYNAFFAETGEEKVVTKLKTVNDELYFIETTTHDRLCEEAFDVVETTYKAVATPNYQTADSEATYDLGYDAIYFEKIEEEEDATDAPSYAYIAAEDLGMEAAELNDYFLGEFTMFVTLDDDNDIEKVLFADCNMTKKTVTDIKLGEVSTNKEESYYAGTEAKLLSGKLIADGEDIYVYNAPYAYANETYPTDADAEGKYDIRNSKNLTAVAFEMETKDETNIYTAAYDLPIVDNSYDETGFYTAQAEELVATFEQVYYDGLYEADLYDVDGDGLYDYINYKPYFIFQVFTDDEEYFQDYDEFEVNELGFLEVYTNGATVLGEEFADEDYVIGYFSYDLELVKVAAVLKPTVDTIANFKKGTGTLTLGNGDKVDGVSAWTKVANFLPEEIVFDADEYKQVVAEDSDLFTTAALDEDEAIELYIYDGVVLFHDEIDTVSKFTENLIIPTDIKDVKEAPFNPDAENEVFYVYAWVDGTAKYVQVELDEDVAPFVTDGSAIADEFLNKLCTYTVKDNLYTITPLSADVFDEDDDVVSEAIPTDIEVLGTSSDEGKDGDQVYADLGEGTIQKVAGSRFDIGFDRDVDFKSYTKIIIRVYDEDKDEYDYVEYDASSFKKSLDEEVVLTNMQAIVSNNVDSEVRENLVVLYAETTDLAFAGKADKNGYRIVSNYDIGQDEEGEWRLYYELYDPYTGAKVYDVASVRSESKASRLTDALEDGTIIELVDGQVEDTKAKYQKGAISTANLVWIGEVDEAEGYFTVVPYNGDEVNKDAIDTWVEDNADTAVTDIYGETIPGNFIDYDKNTVVSVINYSNTDSMWQWGQMSLSSMSAVAAAKKDVLCYNEKAEDRNGNYVTKYADYVKAYVSVDATEYEEGETNAVAEFIIVVVNANENAALDA